MSPSSQPEQLATRYAGHVLDRAGLEVSAPLKLDPEHPALAAARSGLMALTGASDSPPLLCPLPLAACADGVLAALSSLAPRSGLQELRGSQLLTERAAMVGHRRQGAISPGGSCRLLETADGMLALNLARPDDWSLLPAWLEAEVQPDWDAVRIAVAERGTEPLIEQGRALGLAVCAAPRDLPTTPVCALPQFARSASRPRGSRPRVLDLSSLWAGPLCSHLLELMGADVVKLESRQRPDGARRGHAGFFDLLNQRKRSVMLDFASAEGRAQLAQLIAAADIVIEASRPRALRQLGIDAEVLCARHEHLSWIGITGYGRREPQAQWIAFGDDAGVAAGLSSALHAATRQWAFVGDAIGDPITGLHAALYAWAGWQRGGAGIVDIALVGALQSCAVFESQEPKKRWLDWTSALANRQREIWPPAQRTADVPAPALGEHTLEVLSEWLA